MANLRPKGDVPTIWDLARSGDTTNLGTSLKVKLFVQIQIFKPGLTK